MMLLKEYCCADLLIYHSITIHCTSIWVGPYVCLGTVELRSVQRTQ